MGRVRARIARRHDEVQAHRGLGVHEVGDAKVAYGRISGDDRITVEAETRQGGREDAREFVVALAQHLARGLGHSGMGRITEVPGLEHPLERLRLGGVRVGEEPGDAGQRLVALGVQDVQDGAGEQAVGGRLPVVARVLLAGGIDKQIGDVLGVADFVPTFPDFQERIEAQRIEGRGLEAPDAAELPAPARGERPVLPFDVVDEDRMRPAEKRRDHQADALARSGGGEAEDVFGAVMTDETTRFAKDGLRSAGGIDRVSKDGVARLAKDDADISQESRTPHFRGGRPPRAAVRATRARGLAAYGREGGGRAARDRADRRDAAGVAKEGGRTRLGNRAPEEPPPGRVDGPRSDDGPRPADVGRVAKLGGDVLGRGPESGQRKHEQRQKRQHTHGSSPPPDNTRPKSERPSHRCGGARKRRPI